MILAKRSIDQCSGIENPEINSYTYDKMVFSESAKATQGGERTVSSTNGVGK